MTALVRLRLGGYVRAYVAIAPLLAGLVVLSVLYGGGVARPEEAYGVSAIVLFPVMAWQAKIMFDAEPDVQRRLARLAIGSADKEIGAGLISAALTAVPTIGLAIVLPWLFGGVGTIEREGAPPPLSLPAALGIGVWVHLLAVGPAVVFGAWASRAASRSAGRATAVLAGGTVLTIVLGLPVSPVPWLVPPLITTARAVTAGLSTMEAVRLTAWALAWSAIVGVGYWTLRRRRG